MRKVKDGLSSLKILHVVPTFFPALYWGGPIYSVLGMCNALSRRPNVELRVLTTDAAGPRRHERLSGYIGEIRFPAGYSVYYARRQFGVSVSPELLRQLWPLMKWADVVHLTSAYSFPTLPTLLFARLLRKPVVWSPRGAFQRWEKSRKPILKATWEFVCNLIMDRQRCALHVTSDGEARESVDKVRCTQPRKIPNGVEIPSTVPRREWQPAGFIRLLYIGRLDSKKGIENLLDALVQVKEWTTLDIGGTGATGYVDSLTQRVQRLGLAARVHFHGHVADTAKSTLFWSADVCVVPSHTENFAMVVAESLAHGVPVIASTGTPWKEIVEHGCGSWVGNDPALLAQAIRDMRKQDLAQMGARGREWMQREYSWESVAARMDVLYREMIAGACQ